MVLGFRGLCVHRLCSDLDDVIALVLCLVGSFVSGKAS